MVISLGVILKLPAFSWALLVLAIGMVVCTEAMNTAVEVLADRVTLEQDQSIGITKDLAAGAVLLSSLAAVVVGLLIFIPPLTQVITASEPKAHPQALHP
jgi:diacylglycerol kinase